MPSVRAADVKLPVKGAVGQPVDTWKAWIEGGLFFTAGDPIQTATRD